MIPAIAWRNIWRNTTRSLTIMAAVAIGLWGGVFIISLSEGVSQQRKEDVIYNYLSHMQIHQPGFQEDRKLSQFIPGGQRIWDSLAQFPHIDKITGRTHAIGMISSPRKAQGVQITGVWPQQEKQVSHLYTKLTAGSYFEDNVRLPVVMGKALADALKVGLHDKVVLTFQDTTQELVAGAFRVAGIFSTNATEFDEGQVYVRATDMAQLMQTKPLIHELAILVKNQEENLQQVQNKIAQRYPEVTVQNWRQLSPELRYLDSTMDYFLFVFIGIILLALAFGLVNSMLMAVLERTRELGMLMAIGMNKARLFAMIVIETMLLATIGAATGLLLAVVTVGYFSQRGIHFDMVQSGMQSFGMSASIYPAFDWSTYPILILMVIIFALLSAIFPAWKALRLEPVNAIRKI